MVGHLARVCSRLSRSDTSKRFYSHNCGELERTKFFPLGAISARKGATTVRNRFHRGLQLISEGFGFAGWQILPTLRGRFWTSGVVARTSPLLTGNLVVCRERRWRRRNEVQIFTTCYHHRGRCGGGRCTRSEVGLARKRAYCAGQQIRSPSPI